MVGIKNLLQKPSRADLAEIFSYKFDAEVGGQEGGQPRNDGC
jgi:hypothetical protein